MNKAFKHTQSVINRKQSSKFKQLLLKNIKIILIGALILMLVFSLNGNTIESIEIDDSSALSFLNPLKQFLTTGIIIFLIFFVSRLSTSVTETDSLNNERRKVQTILNYQFPLYGLNNFNNIDRFFLPSFSTKYWNEFLAPFRAVKLTSRDEYLQLFENGLHKVWNDDRFVNENSPYKLLEDDVLFEEY